jgi:hypothetical protein
VALIGAGKFGSMFLSQVPHTPGLEVPLIVDLDRDRAREACRTVGWDRRGSGDHLHRRRPAGDCGRRDRCGGGGDRQSAVGIRHAARRYRPASMS